MIDRPLCKLPVYPHALYVAYLCIHLHEFIYTVMIDIDNIDGQFEKLRRAVNLDINLAFQY